MRDVSELVKKLRGLPGYTQFGARVASVIEAQAPEIATLTAERDEAEAREKAAADAAVGYLARAEAAEALLKATLDREAETHRRHDARMEAAEAKVERLAHLLCRQASWVNAALKCQAWQWGVDQREVAEDELAEARTAIAEIGGGK